MTPLSIAACSRSGTSPAEGVERDCPSLQAASSNNNAALARIIHNPLQSLRSDPPIEAACLSRMAGRASRLRAHPDRVLVAINAHLGDVKDMAGGFPLFPQAGPAAGPEMGNAGFPGQRQRLSIPMRHHPHVAGPMIRPIGRAQVCTPVPNAPLLCRLSRELIKT